MPFIGSAKQLGPLNLSGFKSTPNFSASCLFTYNLSTLPKYCPSYVKISSGCWCLARDRPISSGAKKTVPAVMATPISCLISEDLKETSFDFTKTSFFKP